METTTTKRDYRSEWSSCCKYLIAHEKAPKREVVATEPASEEEYQALLFVARVKLNRARKENMFNPYHVTNWDIKKAEDYVRSLETHPFNGR
jgi:hypothetical protein